MGVRGFRTAGAAAAIALTVLVGAAAPASASAVGDNIRAEKRIAREIKVLTRQARTHARDLHRAVVVAQRDSDAHPGLGSQSVLRRAGRAESRFNGWASRRLESLEKRRSDLGDWLYMWGIFQVCPVDGPRYIHNDFGETVQVEGVEPHVHMGSDIEAPSWTPIRAPFDGYAWRSYSPLGGYQVRVRGDRGYVFNAHLIGYGDLGWVGAGTIIGYVGATGDSTASHDHFEWHPWNGGAVDPYYLLDLACD
jgi:murein DD-endopeptidase MepM/ murein hydrolase activator NlpD